MALLASANEEGGMWDGKAEAATNNGEYNDVWLIWGLSSIIVPFLATIREERNAGLAQSDAGINKSLYRLGCIELEKFHRKRARKKEKTSGSRGFRLM
jgi:hypothetical protein